MCGAPFVSLSVQQYESTKTVLLTVDLVRTNKCQIYLRSSALLRVSSICKLRTFVKVKMITHQRCTNLDIFIGHNSHVLTQ